MLLWGWRVTQSRVSFKASLASLGPRWSREGGAVTLRLAESQDALLMFRWQSDDRTRRYFRNPAKPTLDEHLAWFQRYMEDPAGRLCVIEHESTPAGVLRLDPLPDQNGFEVSLLTDPAFYRHGVGVPALLLAREWAPQAVLRAEVLPGNEASRRMVLAAGYVESTPGHFVSLPPDISVEKSSPITEIDFLTLVHKVNPYVDSSWLDQLIEETPLDSLQLMELRSVLEAHIGRGLSDALWFRARTLNELFAGVR